MASFRIHEDQENTSTATRKDAEVFPNASQRRALGDLSHFACNQNRTAKYVSQGTLKSSDENKYMRQIKNEKNIAPPVAQFQAISVYEDKPAECVPKKEPVFKPFSTVELHKSTGIENAKILPKAEKFPDPPIVIESKQEVKEEKENVPEECVGSPISVNNDSSVLSLMSISRNESQLEDNDEDKEKKVVEEETTVAQSAREMFFHVVEYRDDIYRYMREIEMKHRPNPRYMRKQPDISHMMRSILVDWLCEVCEEYSQQSETLHLAVSYVDRFLSYMSVVRNKLQLVGTAATFIAAKYEEVYPPEVGEFAYITDNTYTKREVLRMEHLILKVLSFDLSTPTILSFLSHYCISNALPKKMFHLASYIAELSLLEAEPYLQYKPSMLAAGALATARHCLLCNRCESGTVQTDTPHPDCASTAWNETLARSTGYQVDELCVVMHELARTHSHAHQQPRRAIPDKFKSNRFDAVSTLRARPMFVVPLSPAPLPTEPGAHPAPASMAAQRSEKQAQRVR